MREKERRRERGYKFELLPTCVTKGAEQYGIMDLAKLTSEVNNSILLVALFSGTDSFREESTYPQAYYTPTALVYLYF